MSTRVRVRGIYATALAKLLLDAGFELSDLSQKLKERLGYEGSEDAPHVTVKQSDRDPNELVIIGFPEHAQKVHDSLAKVLVYAPKFLAKPNLHSAYKVVLDENCFAEIEGEKVKVRAGECYEGKETVAEIVRSRVKPKDEVVAEEGFRVIGLYAEIIVGRGIGVTFSRHITSNSLKSMLMNLAADVVAKGFKVHWRSSARNAPLDKLREELERLLDEAYKLMLKSREAPPGTMIYEGEMLAVYNLVLEDKLMLDKIRSKVYPTMPYHHTLKSGGDKLSTAVELGDVISKCCSGLDEAVKEFALGVLKDSKKLILRHEKVDGDEIRIGPGTVKGVVEDYVLMTRKVKEYGKYDGIGAIKEPNDVIATLIKPFSNRIIHMYYSEVGELKGIYVNINTGVEVGEGWVRYLDLEVDVVRREGCVEVIDQEELAKLSEPLVELANEEVKSVIKDISEGLLDELERKVREVIFA